MRLELAALLAALLVLGACFGGPPAPPRAETITSNDGSWIVQVEPPLADCLS